MTAIQDTRARIESGLHVDWGSRTNHVTLPALPGVSRSAVFSFTSWFKLTGDPSDSFHLLFEYSANVNDRCACRIRSGSGGGILDFGVFNGGGYSAISTNREGFNDGAWHFVVCTNEGGGVRNIWIDGVDLTTAGTMSALTNNTNAGAIGYYVTATSKGSHHQMDTRFYSRKLTSSEILLMYEQGLYPEIYDSDEPLDNLIARYQMQDNYSGTLYDSSGNGRHATWVNYDSGVWQTDDLIAWSPALRVGHGADAGTGQTIPRDDSDTDNDINGVELLYPSEDDVAANYPRKVFSIGNSLLADASPGVLGRGVGYVINSGEGLSYHAANPTSSTSADSYFWGDAASDQSWDALILQPFPEDPLQTLATELANCQTIIDAFDVNSPDAIILIHEGFAPSSSVEAGTRIDNAFNGSFDYSDGYFEELVKGLRAANPGRDIRRSQTNRAVWVVKEDLEAGTDPLLLASSIDEIGGDFGGDALYRDGLHINYTSGRYLVHNCCRRALGLPINVGDSFFDHPNYGSMTEPTATYLDTVIDRSFSNVSLLDPSELKPGLTEGANLNPSMVRGGYAGGTPTSADDLKPTLVGADGNLKPSLVTPSGELKPGFKKNSS